MSNFKLSKAITLTNGNEINELELNYDVLSMADLRTANKIAKMVAESNAGDCDNGTFSKRLDPNLQLGVAWCAAIKGTPGLMLNDVLKLAMVDALCLSEDALSNYLFR